MGKRVESTDPLESTPSTRSKNTRHSQLVGIPTQRSMRRCLIAMILLLAAVGILAWYYRAPLRDIAHAIHERLSDHGPHIQTPDPDRYAILCQQLDQWRSSLTDRYSKAKTPSERETIEHEARIVLEHMLPALMRCWIGTRWDFNGTAAKPGQGKIACGYFVSTVLKDAGFQLNRYHLAQQPSSNIIHSFLPDHLSTLSIGQNYSSFTNALNDSDPGIYLCGLDSHVGFIVRTGDDFRFIHSSGCKPWTVVDESPTNATALQNSNWRMLGNLTAHPPVIQSWLLQTPIQVKGR